MDKLEDKGPPEHKGALDFRDLRVHMETRVRRGTRETRETRGVRAIRELLESKEIREIRETKDRLAPKVLLVHLVLFRVPLDLRVLRAEQDPLDLRVQSLVLREHKVGLVLKDRLDLLELLDLFQVETS